MRILVFQHLREEHPGVFRDFWKARGDDWLAVELDEGQRIPLFEGFDLLVAMGGPMDVWQEREHPWLAAEKAAIRRWVVELRRPYLGICLGHQLLAAALDGGVCAMAAPEVGLSPVDLTAAGLDDRLLAGAGATIETFQWHSAGVSRLPDGAKVLATNQACPIQAMRWGDHAYGLQFHVEVTPTTVAEWAAIPLYRASLDESLGPSGRTRLEVEVAARLGSLNDAASRIDRSLAALVAARGGHRP